MKVSSPSVAELDRGDRGSAAQPDSAPAERGTTGVDDQSCRLGGAAMRSLVGALGGARR